MVSFVKKSVANSMALFDAKNPYKMMHESGIKRA